MMKNERAAGCRFLKEKRRVQVEKKRESGGFTLLEMLIVTAIIVVLISIAIPVFTAQLEKTKQAACAANRRSLMALLTVSNMTGEDVEQIYQDNAATYKCPDGGTITYEVGANGAIKVYCSRHAVKGSLGDADTINTVMTLIQKYAKGQLDSAAAKQDGSKAFKLAAALAKEGLDLNTLGAVSWHYTVASKSLFWSTLDINQYDVGSGLAVIRYNSSDHLYSVWPAKVVETTSAVGTYKTLLPDTSTSSVIASGTASYDQAFSAYQKAIRDMGLS